MMNGLDNYNFKSRRIRLINQPKILFAFVILFLSSAFLRLAFLQLIKGSYYRQLSNENRIRLISIPPIRGRFLDHNGEVLVNNRMKYSLSIQPRLINSKTWPLLRTKLSNLLTIPENKLQNLYINGLKKKIIENYPCK